MRNLRVPSVVGVAGLVLVVGVAVAQRQGPPQRPGPDQGRGPSPEAIVDRVFSQSDANGDGTITREEAAGKPIERVFAEIDVNNDGSITREEVTVWLQKRAEAERNGQVTDFEGGMKMAGRAMRGLRRSALDASTRADDLHAVAMIEAGLVGAKLHIDEVEMAPQAKEKYGDDHAAFELALRMGLLDAIGAAIDLEKAVTTGDAQGAHAARDKVVQAMKAGHDAFQPHEDEE